MYRQINVYIFSVNFRFLDNFLLTHFDAYACENRAARGKYQIFKKDARNEMSLLTQISYFLTSYFIEVAMLTREYSYTRRAVRYLAFVQLVPNIRGVTAANFEITRVHVSSTVTCALSAGWS